MERLDTGESNALEKRHTSHKVVFRVRISTSPLYMKYRKQKYSDCQLVAAINSRIYLGLPDITDKEYEHLVDITGGRYGACISIDKSLKYLGLTRKRLCRCHNKCDTIYRNGHMISGKCKQNQLPSIGWISRHLPVVVGVFMHEATIVEVKDGLVKFVNDKHWTKDYYKDRITSINGWYDWEVIQNSDTPRSVILYRLEKGKK